MNIRNILFLKISKEKKSWEKKRKNDFKYMYDGKFLSFEKIQKKNKKKLPRLKFVLYILV